MRLHVMPTGFAHCLAQGRIQTQLLHGIAEVRCHLFNAANRDTNPRTLYDLNGGPTPIQTYYRTPRCHSFETYEAARFMEAWVNQYIRLLNYIQSLGSRLCSQKTDSRFNPKLRSELFEPSSLRSIPNDPIFGMWQICLCKGDDAHIKTFPMEQSTNTRKSNDSIGVRDSGVK
jgi:hypothetical protein